MNLPKHTVPAKWGLCFDGNEHYFCSAIDLAIASTTVRPFRYLEIGLGYGDGMRAVQFYLAQCGIDCRFTGVDIKTCHPSAACAEKYMLPNLTDIYLCGSEAYFKEIKETVNLAFIDGCHGFECVKADFIGVENVIVPGGIVIFHDTDQGCQGLHYQPHCRSGIEARAALMRLGLLDGRHGWKVIAETSGDKSKGGHGISIIQRI